MNVPIPINYKTIGRHLLFWLSYILYLIIGEGWAESDVWILHLAPQVITDLIIIVPLVYINLYLLLPAFYIKRKYVLYICSLSLVLLAGGLLKRFFAFSIWLPIERLNNSNSWQPKDFWILARIAKDTVESFPVVAITMVLKLMRNTSRQERKLRAIEREKFSAEIGMLKAQINPHFFFNTLNSLYSLTMDSSPKSPDVVLRLSSLMRYMLYETSKNEVLLTDELNHLKNYIEIEQMRFGERLDLSFQYSGDLEGQWIAPLLLLPFVENAFKHGVENNQGWITIDLKVIGKRLYLKVENSYTEAGGSKFEGMGLGNVKRRLELLYPSNYQLSLEKEINIYQVGLRIDL